MREILDNVEYKGLTFGGKGKMKMKNTQKIATAILGFVFTLGASLEVMAQAPGAGGKRSKPKTRVERRGEARRDRLELRKDTDLRGARKAMRERALRSQRDKAEEAFSPRARTSEKTPRERLEENGFSKEQLESAATNAKARQEIFKVDGKTKTFEELLEVAANKPNSTQGQIAQTVLRLLSLGSAFNALASNNVPLIRFLVRASFNETWAGESAQKAHKIGREIYESLRDNPNQSYRDVAEKILRDNGVDVARVIKEC